jgi:hypothetical protein
MSNEEPAANEAAPAEAAPAETGTSEAEAAPAPNYLDTDQYADHYVRVRVDGEDQEVPLAEALQGYSRQQDYTRKTQALADQQREAQFALSLQRALESNPEATLRVLQDQFIPPSPPEEAEPEIDWDDPLEVKLYQQEQQIRSMQQAQANRDLQEAVWVLRQRYGDGFNPQAVVGRAMAQGRMDLEGVYKEMAFEQIWMQQQAQQEAERRRQAEDTARVTAKEGLVSHQGVNPASTAQPESGNATTLAEAYYEAKRQLGL